MSDVNFIESNHVKQTNTSPNSFPLSSSAHYEVHSFLPNPTQSDACQDKKNSTNFINKSIKGLRSFKKTDIRVSQFVPVGVNLSEDMISTLRNVEEHSLTNVVKTENICNGTCSTKCSSCENQFAAKIPEKVQSKPQGNVMSFLRLFQDGVKRIGSNSSKSASYHVIIKTVEIVKDPNEILGISIKQRKVFLETEHTAQREFDRQNSSSIMTRKGIFISKLVTDCKAAKVLQVGDEILAVNTIYVKPYDIKSVAAMMCRLKRLILTVRTVQTNSIKSSDNPKVLSNTNQIPYEKQGQSSLFVSLSEKDTLESNTNDNCNNSNKAVSLSNSNLNIKHSVYDNNFDLVPADNKHPNYSTENNLQMKFDESVQILFEAIACCDKSTSVKEKNPDISSLKFQASSTVKDFKSSDSLGSDDDEQKCAQISLLGEIKQTIQSPSTWQPCHNVEAFEGKHNLTQNQNPSKQRKPDGYFTISTIDSNIMTDNNVISDVQSDGSSNYEVNLDNIDLCDYDSNLCYKIQHSQSLPADTLLCVTSKSAEDIDRYKFDCCFNDSDNNVSHSTNLHDTQSQTLNADLSINSCRSITHYGGKTSSKNILYQPNVQVPKFPINLVDPLPTVKTMFKPIVDFNGNHGNITVGKKKEWLNSGNAVSKELKKRIDGENAEKLPQERFGTSSENGTNLQVSGLADSMNTSDGQADHYNSVKKTSSSYLSTSPFIVRKNLSENTEKSNQAEKIKNIYNCVSGDFYQGDNPVDHRKDVSKISSPVHLRKKNRSKKWTKKFKIGNSDSCLKPEDDSRSPKHLQEDVLKRLSIDQLKNQERRLSRPLYFDNKSKEFSPKYLSISQFQKYKPLPVIGDHNSAAVDGCLVITLYGVRELKKSFCEACCLVQVDDATTKRIGTTMQACRGSTTWNQCFEMIVNRARNLHFTVYTLSARGEKHVISPHAVINLPLLLQGHKTLQSNWLAVSLQPRGTLYIKLALETSPSSSGPRLFGADLQSIVDREGGDVPALVRSCIFEVEKRGMNVVGIYRLCGSAIVKKELRRRLEESGGDVDLASTNFPDINVITGILKDFLRELPQPIFPPELLEAVTIAMEQNPGPTPAPVIKEPFSPTHNPYHPNQPPCDPEQKKRTRALLLQIENLPSSPAERATLHALMNHLKKVALNSDKNKMIYQNLAVCFGPVLLGPTSSVPTNRMDIEAALGFKRHIQVLNYMISNWPSEPVIPPAPAVVRRRVGRGQHPDVDRVSLTRRLSRVCADDDDVEPARDDVMDPQPDTGASLVGIPEDGAAFRDPVSTFHPPRADCR